MRRRFKSLVAVFVTFAFTLGGSFAFSTAAIAAPGDPVVFPDQSLENAVNLALGQAPGSTITEGQAQGLTNLTVNDVLLTNIAGIENLTSLAYLNLANTGVGDIALLSGLTNLTDLNLSGNGVVDLAPLSGLTDLSLLTLDNNSIVDVAPLSSLANVTRLFLDNNSIVDVAPLSGLTTLTRLDLDYNSIVDAAPLAGLINLTTLQLHEQMVTLPSVATMDSTANPVIDVAGVPVAVSSSSAGFSYDGVANEWTFAIAGAKELTWSTYVAVGEVNLVRFDGTINQRATAPEPVGVSPQNPVVVDAVCLAGETVAPTITLPTTEGIVYAVEGEVTPGTTVTVRATATAGHFVMVEADTNWLGDSDGVYATLEVALKSVDCDTPPVIDEEELPKTGANQWVTTFGVLAGLLTLGGVALVTVRRRSATR